MLKNKLTVAAVILGVVLVSLVALNLTDTEEELTTLPEKVTWPERGTPVVDPIRELQKDVKKLNDGQLNLWKFAQHQSDSLQTKQDVLDDRQTLMAILINNNFAAIRDGHEEDIVFLNGDWTINKMPKRLTLTDKDREFLMRFITTALEND